jgi:hypothetical protein
MIINVHLVIDVPEDGYQYIDTILRLPRREKIRPNVIDEVLKWTSEIPMLQDAGATVAFKGARS